MGSVIGAIVSWVLQRFFGLKKASDPTPVELAQKAAQAEDAAQQETTSAQIIATAAGARADASDGVVRVVSEQAGEPAASVVAAIKRADPGDFRD